MQVTEEVISVFESHLRTGPRGKMVRPISELAVLAAKASSALLTEFLRLHREILSFGPSISTVGTGHKGLVLDYYPTTARAQGTKFCALWAVPERQQLHVYFHRLRSVVPVDDFEVHYEPSSGTPNVWIDPEPDISARLIPQLRESFEASLT